jgi:predicted enzyme related to lactoylglutathione lyase
VNVIHIDLTDLSGEGLTILVTAVQLINTLKEKNMTQETGTISWFDFPTHNEEKAMMFYKTLLNWNFIPMEPTYWGVQVGEEFIGALRQAKAQDLNKSNAFVMYFNIPSVKEGKELIERLGGKLVGPTVDINKSESGYYQKFLDLDGHLVAIWSQKA